MFVTCSSSQLTGSHLSTSPVGPATLYTQGGLFPREWQVPPAGEGRRVGPDPGRRGEEWHSVSTSCKARMAPGLCGQPGARLTMDAVSVYPLGYWELTYRSWGIALCSHLVGLRRHSWMSWRRHCNNSSIFYMPGSVLRLYFILMWFSNRSSGKDAIPVSVL